MSSGAPKKPGKTTNAAQEILSGKSKKGPLARILPFMGPAVVASVAYMDPGNFATNIQAGSTFGYKLLWVVVASNLMAMLIQTLSAKLGIATGKNLAELCRDRYGNRTSIALWLLAEGVAMATDLAEFLGAAVGFQLLLGVPLWLGGLVTVVATYLILGLEKRGFRTIEAVITAFVGVIALCYLVETVLDKPDWTRVAYHAVVPSFSGTESVLLASGILGATVMPHVIYLHSALTQGRIVTREPGQLRKLFRYQLVDVMVAMGVAGMVNAAMLIMAASTFHKTGLTTIAGIEDAYKTLAPLLGPAAGTVFALSLLASGLSSSAVGTMAGQVVMQGFVHKQIPVWIRRGATILPSMIVIFMGLNPTRVLVISQVVLSFGLPFAVIPLVRFTADKKLMGVLVNRKLTTITASLVAILIIGLNLFLIYQTIFGG